MSRTVSRGREAGRQAEALAAGEPRESRGRGRWVALGVVVVVAAGAVAAWRAGVFSPAAAPGSGQQGAPAPATAAVTRQDLSATTPVTATLGYAGSYAVTGQGGGTLTWLPSPGQVIGPGQALYKTGNGSPVALLYGSVPDWRALDEGTTGQDVTQLNHDLVQLGYADSADIAALGWDYYSWETAYGVQRLEEHLGVASPPGSLSLGQVVFEPEALRVSQVTGSLGEPGVRAGAGRDLGPARGDIPLDVSQQSRGQGRRPGDGDAAGRDDHAGRDLLGRHGGDHHRARAGAEPGHDDPGAGQVDRSERGGNPGPGAGDGEHHHRNQPRPGARGAGDGAGGPVIGRVRRRGYRPGNTRRWVPVQPGIFDDDNGLVQVTGNLTPGQRVVVSAS